MIYFAQLKGGGPIKIGTSVQLSRRIGSLRCAYGADLEILAVMPGRRPVEAELHKKFAHLNHENEWFNPGEELLVFISENAAPWDGTDEVPVTTVQLGIEISPRHARILDEICRKNRWTKRVAIEQAIEALWKEMTGETLGGKP